MRTIHGLGSGCQIGGGKRSPNFVFFPLNEARTSFWFFYGWGQSMNCFEFLKVKDWHSEYECINKPLKYLRISKGNSSQTKNNALEIIYLFCVFLGIMNPSELLVWDGRKIETQMEKFLARYSNNKTKNAYTTLIKIFFRENDRTDIKYVRYHEPSRPTLKILPLSLADGWKMVESADYKFSAFLSLDLVTGLRDSTALSIRYGQVITHNSLLDQFTLKNELQNGIKNPIIVIYPEMKKIRDGACKGKVPYYTFLHERARGYLARYIRKRIVDEGPIKDNDLLFPTENRSIPKDERSLTPMTLEGVNYQIKRIAKIAELQNADDLSCQSFRILFENVIDRDPNTKNVSDIDRKFFLGRVLPKPQENYHHWDDIEYMREQYSKLLFLPGEFGPDNYWEPVARFHKIPYEFVTDTVHQHYGKNASRDHYEAVLKDLIDKRMVPIVVDEDKLIEYMSKGWKHVSWTPSGKALLTRDILVQNTENKKNTQDEKEAIMFDSGTWEKHFIDFNIKICEPKSKRQQSLDFDSNEDTN